MVLRGAYSQPLEAILDEWDDGGKAKSLRRANKYMDLFDAGEPCDWQYECTMRLFGWERYSKRWERWVRRFREAVIVVAKKNKKSPTASGWSMYTLCGDGEPGQKVFLTAKDGNQVRKNMGAHILEMVRQSPELDAECKINLNEMSVLHEPSRSVLMPLSSSNVRTQKSKEGINGSVFVDEVHIVDREHMRRITRTGISRSEPLRVEVTTAGNDPDSYGHERCEYARDVIEGRAECQHLFAAIYEAPATLSDADLEADPVKYGRMANPAWGHTIDEEEYLADYATSKRTISELADFKMYRLNIWQRSSNPWLRSSDWCKCQRDFAEPALIGQPCGAGLDLGQVDDMSAFSLAFPESAESWLESISETKAVDKSEPMSSEAASRLLEKLEQPMKILTWYWLPEGAIEKYSPVVPEYRTWVRDGFLRVTSGDTLQPEEILSDLRTIFAMHNVLMFGHDPWHASLLVSALQKSSGFPEEYCWPFKQDVTHFAFPTALMQRLIVGGKLHHNGNPITAWQAGHVCVKSDVNANIRPIKPPQGNRKKIDGIVSMIMAIDAATRMVPSRSYYEDHEVRYV